MSIRRHAADWIKVMGEKLNDSGKEIMFALRDRLGTFSNSPLAGAMQGSKTGCFRTDRIVLCHWMSQCDI